MAQLVVRNIENRVKERLQRRARRNGRSMEQEVREILREATNREESASAGGLGTEIASIFRKVGFEADIPELRGHMVQPPDFEK